MPPTDRDLAVVLGAPVDPSGRPGPALLRRVAHGIGLYRQGRVSHLLLSGGIVRHAPAEAEMMRLVALAGGVSPDALLTESRSRNTLENAAFCKPIIEGGEWRRVLVVTDAYHLPRALYTFRRLGLAVEGAAVPSSRRRVAAGCREAVAFLLTLWRVEQHRRGG